LERLVTIIHAILLGIIQGFTEFLPVSSSGHLILFQHLFGLTNLDQYILFDLIVHLGTLIAVLCFFYKPIKIVLLYDRTQVYWLILATLPLFPLVFLLKPIKALFDKPEYLGFFFLITALLLFLGIKSEKSEEKSKNWKDALFIGIFQSLAILPGISRSGSTISAALIKGWNYTDALRFSFFLAILAIIGGIGVEILHSGKELWNHNVPLIAYILGFITSFFSGFLALGLLSRLATKSKFMYFVWYCVFIGIFALVYI
jgi:undecaprenyl-diphosphatase